MSLSSELKGLWLFQYPIALSFILDQCLATINYIFIGHYGSLIEIAAVSTANVVQLMLFSNITIGAYIMC